MRRVGADDDAAEVEAVVGVAVVAGHIDVDTAAFVDGGSVGDSNRGIVHRGDTDADGDRVGFGARLVLDGVGETVSGGLAAVVLVADGAIGIDGKGAVGRAAGDGDAGQVEAVVSVAVVIGHTDVDAATFVDGCAVGHSNRGVVHRGDADADGDRVRLDAGLVLDGVGEAVFSGLAAIVLVADGTVGVDCEGAVGRATGDGDAAQVEAVVGVRVVTGHTDVDAAAFVDGGAVGYGNRRVVHRGDPDVDGDRVGLDAGFVLDGVGEAVGGGLAAIVLVADGTVGVDGEGAVGRAAGDGDAGQVEAVVGVRVVAGHIDVDAAAFIDDGSVGHGNRRVVHRRDPDVDGDRVGLGAGLVLDGVGEAVGGGLAAVVLVADGAIGVDDHGAVGRATGDGDAAQVEAVVSVAVVIGHTDVDAATFVDGGSVGDSNRGVVHRGDGDVDCGGFLVPGGGGDGVGVAVGAVVVGARGVGDGAVGVQGDGAMGGGADRGDLGAGAEGVVGQDVGSQRLVLGDGDGIVLGVDDRLHSDVDGAGDGAAVAVADGDGEAVAAVEVGARGVGVGAVGAEGDAAMGRRGADGVGQAIAVQVAGLDGAGNRGVFVGGDGEVVAVRHVAVAAVDHRGVVHRGNRDGSGRWSGILQAIVVHGCIFNGGGAVPVGIRHECDSGAIGGCWNDRADTQDHAIEEQRAVARQRLDDEVVNAAVHIRSAQNNRNTFSVFVAGSGRRVGLGRVVLRGNGDGQR